MSSRTAAIMASKEKCKRNRDNWKARALKAEAMCEWLAGKTSDRDVIIAMMDGATFRSPDHFLAAAREAVTRGE